MVRRHAGDSGATARSRVPKPRAADPESPLRPDDAARARLMADYAGTSLTIGPHPLALRRPSWRCAACCARAICRTGRHGRRVRVAGAVITRQRPGTAKGFVFLTLEDETGIANVIVRPDLFTEQRRAIIGEPYLLVEGTLQIQEGVTSVKAERVIGLSGDGPRAAVARFSYSSSLTPAQSGLALELQWRRLLHNPESLEHERAVCNTVTTRRTIADRRESPRLAVSFPCILAGLSSPVLSQSNRRLPGPPTPAQMARAVGSHRAGSRSVLGRRREARWRPTRRQPTPSSRSSAPASAAATRSRTRAAASGARSSRRRRRPRSSHRASSGALAITSRRSTTCRAGMRARRRHRIRSCRPGSARRSRTCTVSKPKADWSYYQNPFVGTREMNGLLVLQAMLGNSDLKDAQNALYKLKEPFEGAQRLVRRARSRTDRSAAPACSMRRAATSTCSSRRRSSRASSTARCSSTTAAGTACSSRTSRRPTCAGSAGSSAALTDEQWRDAFRAGGYPKPVADRFIRRMKQKIAEGLALKD